MVLVLAQATLDMRATVEQGLAWLKDHRNPQPEDSWLLIPADHPTLHREVVGHLFEARQRYPECSIFVPSYNGRRGHPTLLAWKHVPSICAMPADVGLNVYIRGQNVHTKEVPIDDPTILWDLDTPADYVRLQDFLSRRGTGR
jgi:molybdenum cofactor cytidylyltransferase